MKKSIICGIASLAMATMPVFGAFATDIDVTGGIAHDVSVGEIDETIYAVDINWGDMDFDWKYNPLKNDYAFFGDTECVMPSEQDLNYLAYTGNLYSNYNCTEKVVSEGPIDPEGQYYAMVPGAYSINFWDESVNGKIKAQASFTPAENYTWAKGVFSDLALSYPRYVFAENAFDSYTETDGTFTSGMGSMPLPGQANHQMYSVLFHLEIDKSIEHNAELVSVGDKIGAITISISPDVE